MRSLWKWIVLERKLVEAVEEYGDQMASLYEEGCPLMEAVLHVLMECLIYEQNHQRDLNHLAQSDLLKI